MLAFEMRMSAPGGEPAAHGLSWPDAKREPALFASAVRAGEALRERAPPSDAPPPAQWTLEGSKPMGEQWLLKWRAACADLRDVLRAINERGDASDDGCNCVLGYLFARLGHECGAMLRAIHAAGYSWGAFTQPLTPSIDH